MNSNIPLLSLTFEDALVPSRFAQELRRSSKIYAVGEIQRSTGLSLQGAKALLERGQMRVAFDKGAKGVRLMRDKTGRELATLVNSTGKTTANARRVGKAARVATATTAAALVLVELAHVVSDQDNAIRLKKVEVGVDRLIRAHHAELKARLRSVYGRAKEILSHGASDLTDQDRQELQGYCGDLLEIRARWSDDFKFQLQQIEVAKPGFLRSVIRVGRDEAHARAKRARAAEATAELETLQLINFSIMLQMVLSAALARITEFQNITLPDEIERLLHLLEFAEQRATQIAGEDSTAFQPFLQAIGDTIDVWIEAVPPPRSARLQNRAIGG
ncbi:MAG: hypothetical protein ACR2MW_02075 [Chthoniobacterales bacterium]